MKSPLTLSPWLCGFLAFLGVGTLAVRLVMDVLQSTSNMTWWTPEWWTQAGQMSLPTLFVIGFSLAGGVAIRYRSWVIAGLVYAIAAAFLFATSIGNIDFIVTQTTQKQEIAKVKATEAKDIAEIQNNDALAARKEMRENLWRTYYAHRKQEDKDRTLAEIKKIDEKPVALQRAEEVAVGAGGGKLLERWTGVKAETWIEIRTLIVPLGLMVAEVLALSLAIGARPRKEVGAKVQDESASIPQENDEIWTLSSKSMSKVESLLDLRQIFPTKTHPLTLPFLTARWGLTSEGARQRLKDWEDRKLITLGKTQGRTGPVVYVKSVAPVLVASNGDLKASA